MLCPKCKTDHAHRSHKRGIIERIVALAGYYPHRCRACQYRFLRSGSEPAAVRVAGKLRVEREIKATRNAMKAARKRRELLLYGTAIVVFLTFLYYITRDHGSSIEGGYLTPRHSSSIAQAA